jgi:hypothetical protein
MTTTYSVRRLGRILVCHMPLMIVGAACTDAGRAPTQIGAPIDVRAFVTSEVASSLDPQGFFVFPDMPGDATHISAARAREIAAAEVATFESFNRTSLEKQRGAPIDLAALRVEPRVFYAESPYIQDIPSDVHPAIRKYAGPYYIVTLSDQSGPVLSAAISAYDTDVAISNGLIVLAKRNGGDFRVQAVRTSAGLPIAPEHAARIASEALHVPISAVPVLILPSNSYVPQVARWRLQLQRPVSVRGARSGRVADVQTVYVGFTGELLTPRGDGATPVGRPNPATRLDPLTGRTVPLHLRADIPIDFEPISR